MTLYESFAHRYPIASDIVSSSVLWSCGDVAAQMLEERSKIDWKRVGIQAIYAGVIWAPFGHYWYRALDRIGHRMAASLVSQKSRDMSGQRRKVFLTSKILLEALLLHPVALVAYFVSIGKMNGHSMSHIGHKLKDDYVPTLGLEIALWTPLDLVNFAYVPVRHQLLVVNCGCFVESVGLSYIQRNGFPMFEYLR